LWVGGAQKIEVPDHVTGKREKTTEKVFFGTASFSKNRWFERGNNRAEKKQKKKGKKKKKKNKKKKQPKTRRVRKKGGRGY